MITKRTENVLKDIADVSNGIYIDGNKTEIPVNEIAKVIGSAQKSEFETKQFSDYKDQFQWFIGIGILFLIIDGFFFEKKTKWLRKVDLFDEEKNKNN